MYESIHYSDLPMLMGRGFQFGMFDTCLWGTTKDGKEYQAVIDGEWIRFGERLPKGNVSSLELMGRDQFEEMF